MISGNKHRMMRATSVTFTHRPTTERPSSWSTLTVTERAVPGGRQRASSGEEGGVTRREGDIRHMSRDVFLAT